MKTAKAKRNTVHVVRAVKAISFCSKYFLGAQTALPTNKKVGQKVGKIARNKLCRLKATFCVLGWKVICKDDLKVFLQQKFVFELKIRI